LIQGPAGCGKTSLLEALSADARDLGVMVLSARGAELERPFPFGVVRQLFEPELLAAREAKRRQLLAGAGRLGAAALDPKTAAEQPKGSDASFAAIHGLYWLLVNFGSRSPFVLTVDDVQWADDPSLRWLAYAVPRIEEVPVLVALALREGEPAPSDRPLSDLLADGRITVVSPAPLSETAILEIVRGRLSRKADAGFCAVVHRATGGNPFLVSELLHAAELEGITGMTKDARRLEELHAQGVSRSIMLRLSRLGEDARRIARAVAILGGGGSVRQAAALAGISEPRAAAAIDRLIAADLLRGPPLDFVHPLVRQSVYGEVPPAERTLAHYEAALLLHEASVPADLIAGHLLKAEPRAERWAVDVLREAARQALARGAPDAAAAYLARALDEPPQPPERSIVLRELGSAELLAGELGDRTAEASSTAVGHLTKALELETDPVARAEISLELGDSLWALWRGEEAVAVFDEASSKVEAVDRELALLIQAHAAGASLFSGPVSSQVSVRLRRLGTVDGRTPNERLLLGLLAYEKAFAGDPVDEVVALARRSLSGGRSLPEEASPMSLNFPPVALVFADRLDEAEAIFEDTLARARKGGAIRPQTIAYCWRARISYLRSAIRDAEADARTARAMAAERGWERQIPATHAFLIDALLEAGELGEAETTLEASGIEEGKEIPPYVGWTWLLQSRGRLRLALGNAEGALEDFLVCGRRQEEWGPRNPAVLSWRSGAVLALLALANPDEAKRLANEELDLARGFGAPTAIGVALGAVGLAEGGLSRTERLREAVRVLENSPAKIELARSLTELGAALRRANQRVASREPLRRALDIGQRGGANAIVKRAHQELVATGARPRRLFLSGLDSLTASERRVAAMAAGGLSNREIAQALFVTVKTVEVHLSNAYRKLDIKSRAELPESLLDDRRAAEATT
jgi:DNA-binding CsgD family transcriptional regulator